MLDPRRPARRRGRPGARPWPRIQGWRAPMREGQDGRETILVSVSDQSDRA